MPAPTTRPPRPTPDDDGTDTEDQADTGTDTGRPATRPNPPAGAPPTSTGSRPGASGYVGNAAGLPPGQAMRQARGDTIPDRFTPGATDFRPVTGGPAAPGAPAGNPLAAVPLANLPDHAFALPGRRYPIHTPQHALASLDAIAQRGTPFEQGMVTGMVKARHPGINVYGPRAVIPQQHL